MLKVMMATTTIVADMEVIMRKVMGQYDTKAQEDTEVDIMVIVPLVNIKKWIFFTLFTPTYRFIKYFISIFIFYLNVTFYL